MMGRESRVTRATPKTPKHPTAIDYAKPRTHSLGLARIEDVQRERRLARFRAKLYR